MTLVRFDEVSLEFGDQPLLVKAGFAIENGERVCLIGRNGAGKSSMLQLISGTLLPDHGEVQRRAGLCVGRLDQALVQAPGETVYEVVAAGLAELGDWCAQYRRSAARAPDRQTLAELQALQQRIEAHGGWNIEQRVNTLLSELELPGERALQELSGGWRRRVALARALVNNPDLLLLDEPTNHLDLSTIEWLENRVLSYSGSVLFITHDRAFLERLATRIVELDRGRLSSWPGSYRQYLAGKQKMLAEEASSNALFDKRLAREEAWVREGIKARRTRNEGRVRALEALREQRAARLPRQSQARVYIDAAEASGRKVIEVRNLRYGYGGVPLVDGFSIRILRGERIGIVGNNGVGKSTLLQLLLGEIAPQEGSVKHGTNLQIGYFDQLRRELDPDKTVAETVGAGREYIRLNGKDRHVVGYLKGFLFSPKRALSPVSALSGGERNRLILARLFTRASNLLVLDEPTNDLDVETLQVLEQRLREFTGTLLVVSHDREFLDNVVTSILVFEAGGAIQRYAGGYSDWARRGRRLAETDTPGGAAPGTAPSGAERRSSPPSGKLSYKLQYELERLPGIIDALEAELADLHDEAAESTFYTRPYTEVQAVLEALTGKQRELDAAVERWAELEERKQGG